MLSLTGKVGVVTGATSGISRAATVALAAAGAKVVAAGRRETEGQAPVRLVHDAGGEAYLMPIDVSRDEDVAGLIGAALNHYGGQHCGVNNAGIELNVGMEDAPVRLIACSEPWTGG